MAPLAEKYLWQGLTRLLAVYDGSDNLLMRFEYVDGRMPVAMAREGVTYFLAYDPVGSLRMVADAAGNVVKSITYDTFGNIITDSNPAFTVPFGFAGGLYDPHTGLVRFGFRDYDPDTGRWTAKDPIFFGGRDTDLYGYCLNDPVNFIDPLGLWDMITSYRHFHNQGAAASHPGYTAPQRENLKVPNAVKDLSKSIVDRSAQQAAENLAGKYLSPLAKSVLKKTNALFGIFDPFPPPAGGPMDMIDNHPEILVPEPSTRPTKKKDSPC